MDTKILSGSLWFPVLAYKAPITTATDKILKYFLRKLGLTFCGNQTCCGYTLNNLIKVICKQWRPSSDADSVTSDLGLHCLPVTLSGDLQTKMG